MKSPNRQRGFLLIVAVLLIVAASVFAVFISYLTVGSAQSGVLHLGSAQVLYAAETGLERGLYERNQNSWDCTTPASYTATLGTGSAAASYSVTCILYNPTSTTLTADILDTDTVIPVAALTGYASFGRVTIDSESINYSGTSSTSCGSFSTPCLTDAERGVGGTATASHTSGTSVAQNQYVITSVGTSSDTGASRTLEASVDNTGTSSNLLTNGDFASNADNWTLSASFTWDGTDGNPAGSIKASKTGGGTATRTAEQTLSSSVTTTASTVFTVTFDYKVSSGNTQFRFELEDSTGTTYQSTPSNFSGGWSSGTKTITVPSGVTITKFTMTVRLLGGGAKDTWVDNVVLTYPTLGSIQFWREAFP